MLRRILPVCLVTLGACAGGMEITQLPVEPFAGHVLTTAKGSWFTPCGAEGGTRWWVTYVDDAVRQVREAKSSGAFADNERTFVRWRASRTDEKVVGPGGPALLVRDIFEIRPPGDDDCRRPAS